MMRNRSQIVLLIMGTVILTGLTVVAAAFWLDRPTLLTIAVGQDGGAEQRFATKLASSLEQNSSSIRLSVISNDNNGQALARFARRDADLVILRTDAKIPPHARAIAVLEHEIFLLIGAPNTKFDGIGDLEGKKLAILSEDGRNDVLVRRILDQYDIEGSSTSIQNVPPGSPIDSLLAPGKFQFVIAMEPLSRITTTKIFEDLAQHFPGFTLNGFAESDALERRIPGLFSENIVAGLLSGVPRIPNEDLETVGVQKILVVRNKLADSTVTELMRVLFENKSELSVDQLFATRIEPPDVEKDSLIAAHNAAAQYVEDDVQTFFDRYSDVIYLVMSVASVVGSVGFALFTSVTRVRPQKASDRADDILEITDRIRGAKTLSELDIAEKELEDILKEMLRGLKDGTIASEGLDAFRLSYEHAREAVSSRRRLLTIGTPDFV